VKIASKFIFKKALARIGFAVCFSRTGTVVAFGDRESEKL
jgi:hypothetical protein